MLKHFNLQCKKNSQPSLWLLWLLRIISCTALFCCTICTTNIYAGSTPPKLSANPTVQAFISSIAQSYQFDRRELTELFDTTVMLPEIITTMQHPYEEQPWYVYKQRLVSQQRINLGLQYWEEHATALEYATKTYGIPASIIVAIVGIESMYGRTALKYPVLNSLITLSFAYPQRATFFQHELVHYLLLTRALNIDPKTIFGSYAGAIGLPQFMPSSYRHFAIQYHPEGAGVSLHSDDEITTTTTTNTSQSAINNAKKLGDLIHDTDDVVVSIANYLFNFNWHANEEIAIKASVKGEKYQDILATKTLKPQLTIAQLQRYRVKPKGKNSNKITPQTKAALIELQNKDENEYWLGLHNLYVLTHYNSSKAYVMAVFQLAQALEQARNQTRKNSGDNSDNNDDGYDDNVKKITKL